MPFPSVELRSPSRNGTAPSLILLGLFRTFGAAGTPFRLKYGARDLSLMVSKRLLPLIPAGLVVDHVVTGPDRVTITTHASAAQACCPACGRPSSRLHSHYDRTLADLPWQGRPVAIRVRARRFRCAARECPRQVFAEGLPTIAPAHARRSRRLGDIQRHIGLAAGGEPGSRLSHRLAMPVSGDTLLRLIRSARWEAPQTPRVIGIDEWAWKRGQTYGTILCDLEKGRVLDLLPDREAATVSAWLKRHPGVEVIARDRATVFARAIREAAPNATQVADRWHLLHNLGDALRTAVGRHRRAVSAAGGIERSKPDQRGLHKVPAGSPGIDGLRRERRQARAERYAEVSRLHADGLPPREIARAVGMSQRSVERWLSAGGEPEHRRPPVASLVDPFRPYLDRRWREGCRNTRQLWREIVTDGFKGSFATLARWAAPLRGAGSSDGSTDPVMPPAAPRPSRRRCAWLLGCERDELTAAERAYIERLTAKEPALATVSLLARSFAAMVRGGDASGLDAWIASAGDSDLGGLATGVTRDRAAVAAAITEPWSTSPVEGHINRLKAIKRSMYGRAGYQTLRARMLAA